MKMGNELDLYRAGYVKEVAQRSSRSKLKIAPFKGLSVCIALVLRGIATFAQVQVITGRLK
jgi:hypothetical protein